jgi:hypothetical protein
MPIDDRDTKALAKLGWLAGAVTSSSPIGWALGALPFMFPKAADRVAGVINNKINDTLLPMLYPDEDKKEQN